MGSFGKKCWRPGRRVPRTARELSQLAAAPNARWLGACSGPLLLSPNGARVFHSQQRGSGQTGRGEVPRPCLPVDLAAAETAAIRGRPGCGPRRGPRVGTTRSGVFRPPAPASDRWCSASCAPHSATGGAPSLTDHREKRGKFHTGLESSGARMMRASVLECACPPALWGDLAQLARDPKRQRTAALQNLAAKRAVHAEFRDSRERSFRRGGLEVAPASWSAPGLPALCPGPPESESGSKLRAPQTLRAAQSPADILAAM